MNKKVFAAGALAITAVAAILVYVQWSRQQARLEQLHYEHRETELVVANQLGAQVVLFRAGANLDDTTRVAAFNGRRMWLPAGNYFLQVRHQGRTQHLPVPLAGYRAGPDDGGAFYVTLRRAPQVYPPRLLPGLPEFVFIPSGSFLFGDRLNPREPHYLWLSSFFIHPFEVSNEEFRVFLRDSAGYADDRNWTAAGRRWKMANASQATALLSPQAPDYVRFGQPDQPVVWVNWFEANAYCKWLTRKIGGGRWLFTLPNEAEWEKAARGPDNFDYGLSLFISDREIPWYNWKKNPDVPVTVVGWQQSPTSFRPNRYGLYHMSGNVVEWTQSLLRAFNRERPFRDDDRNHEEAAGLRVARGGSWYSASVALLYLPYRDAFQPEHSSQDIGFRLVARMLP
ncbi:MAG: formylglycine-generating enzyme family protein [candidate division KSB1 bacterium]|nr:formylglycine-generating enzyme family protein [candidate division KSB1 bacterium]MDZ7274209.1 formylglycine-generating enzyme family protein [candidate division KSB1 bacterium]MDZ7287269.1 formylglycine-generating enzyme family protein [candidate division KSB1 bacterium]MDZ7296807.1 formylglycine-generating enzyme family protein [candidate division KSB1 bacterium]MDZ7308440.1 formylglycine-generating enzyme family protein [candidate division KSB1 bacterium]